MPDAISNPGPPPDAPRERSSLDDVIALYKRDVDRTLLRENLRLTPEERIRKLVRFLALSQAVRDAGRAAS